MNAARFPSVIGLIPAGGKATRIHGLPKMLLPVGNTTLFERLVRQMSVRDRRILVAPSSATIGFLYPYLTGNVLVYGTNARTMTEDMLLARLYAEDEPVLFGMPDTYIEDAYAFPKLVMALSMGADVAVGVFLARPGQHKEGGMCRLEGTRLTEVVDKPDDTDVAHIWGVLAWRPAFWGCLEPDDPHVGYGLPRAIERGLDVRAVEMQGGFWDCGTAERYYALLRHLTEPVSEVVV